MVKVIAKTDKEEADKVLNLSLKQTSDGVWVMGTDADGEDWFLIKIDDGGTFKRCIAIGKSTGLQLDSLGRIMERE